MKATWSVRAYAVAWGAAFVLGVAALPAAAQESSADHIDDVTAYSYAQFADGSPAVYEVVRTFPRNIKSLRVTIIGGQADDIGYVGSTLVTDVAPACRRVSSVVAPVDVTHEVTVSGNTASFTLTALENCCCYTGWGPDTEAGRAPATFRWVVELEPECSEAVCLDKCAEGEREPTRYRGGISWESKQTSQCPLGLRGEAGGALKVKGEPQLAPVYCGTGCKSELGLKAEVELEAYICGGRSYAFTQQFDVSRTTQHEKACNRDTCRAQCDPNRYCVTQGGSYTLEVGAQQSYPLGFHLGSPGRSTVAVRAMCKGTLGVSGSTKLGVESKDNQGSTDLSCRTCSGAQGELALGASGSLGCAVGLNYGGVTRSFGCKDCAQAFIKTAFKGSQNNCGGASENCTGASVEYGGKLELEEGCDDLFGMRVKHKVSASGKQKCETSTCGPAGGCAAPKYELEVYFDISPNATCS